MKRVGGMSSGSQHATSMSYDEDMHSMLAALIPCLSPSLQASRHGARAADLGSLP